MRIIAVSFKNFGRIYEYRTSIPMIVGAEYNIVADGITKYSTPVTVIGYRKTSTYKGPLREITEAKCIYAPPAPEDPVEKVYFNEEKGVTVVIWKEGAKTILTCAPGEKFDREKAIALAFMKRYFRNRGAYNEVLKKWVASDEISNEKKD